MVFSTDGVTCVEILEAHCRADVSGLHELDRVLMVGVHLIKTGNPLLLVGSCIEHIGTGIDTAGISPEESKTAHERIGCNLEYQTAERICSARLTLFLLTGLRVLTGNCTLVQRRREITHHGVEKELHALVLEGRTAAYRNHLHRDGTLAESGDDFLFGEGVRILEVLLHQSLVALSGRLDELVPPPCHLIGELGRNISHLVVHKLLFSIIVYGLVGDKVNNTLEFVL